MAAISSLFSGCARTPSPSSSTRCFFKNHGGLSAQSSGLFCSARSDLSKTFHKKDKQFAISRLRLSVACRAGMIMMPFGEPIVPYDNPDGSYQWIDVTNALLRDRVVCLSEFIDDDFSNAILGTLLYLDTVYSAEDIKILVLGSGGDVQPTLQIYDTMESLGSEIATYALGFLSNLSGYILAAGDKGKRHIMATTIITFEPIYGAARGDADDIINEAAELARLRDYLFKQLESKTGQPFEKIQKDFQRRMIFQAQEAIDYGLADKMLRPPKKKIVEPPKKKILRPPKKKILRSPKKIRNRKKIGDGLG